MGSMCTSIMKTTITPHHRHHQVRRKMEDENRKARRNARREYMDNVRELVAFVKKRDKRVARAQVSRGVGGMKRHVL